MAFVHGKGAAVSLDSTDLSAYSTEVSFSVSVDSHDVTTFGKTAHVFQGGLTTGECTLTGVYDNGASGPQAEILPLVTAGEPVELVYHPEGSSGAGKPVRTVDVLVTSYEETAPVADMITWTANCTLSDTLALTTISE